MNVTYKALDGVDYQRLCYQTHDSCMHSNHENQNADNVSNKSAELLVNVAASVIIKSNDVLESAIHTAPCHLANTLLRCALINKNCHAVSTLVAQWPLETLEMRSIYPEGKTSLFSRTMDFDTALFMGLMNRENYKDQFKLKCLDFRGFQINEIFSRVLIGALPLLSIKKEDRDTERLTAELMQFLAVEGSGTSTDRYDSLEEDMKPIIQSKIEQFQNGYVYVPDGEQLVVKVDKLEFGRENGKYMEYLVMGGLRGMTPCRLEAYNLYIETNIKENERLIDSCAPFLALLGQDPEILRGLSLNNMEDMLFQYILRGVARFTSLRALDVGNCSICMTGKTRVRSALRSRIVFLFSTFTQLTRLDIRKSELTGNLKELLEALKVPLEYLNLSGCQIGEEDLVYLGESKHSTSLKEVHLSSLVRRGEIETPECILNCVSKMVKNLHVLEIQNNEIGDDRILRLCSMLPQFEKLKVLDTLYNFMSQESLLKLVESVTRCSSMHCMAINLLPIFGTDTDVMERRVSFQQKCEEVLHKFQRRDMSLVVVAIGIE